MQGLRNAMQTNMNPDTVFTSRLDSPQARANWNTLQMLVPADLRVDYEEMRRRWEATGRTLTWNNVKSLREEGMMMMTANDNGNDDDDSVAWRACVILIDLLYIGLGCWSLRATLSRNSASKLLVEVTELVEANHLEFEHLMEALEAAEGIQKKAKAIFYIGKFFAGALSLEAVYKALFGHLSAWEMFLYGVCGITEIVAAFASDGVAFVAQVVYVLSCTAFLVEDISKLIEAWKKGHKAQTSGLTLGAKYKIMLSDVHYATTELQKYKRYLNGFQSARYCLMTTFVDGSRWKFESSGAGGDGTYKIKCVGVGKKCYLHKVQEQRHNDSAQRDADLVEDPNISGTTWEVKREGDGSVVITNTSNGVLSGSATSQEGLFGGVWVMVDKPNIHHHWFLVQP